MELLLLSSLMTFVGPSTGTGPSLDSERGRIVLQRVHSLATNPRYGDCWTRALEDLDTRCKDMTSDNQSRMALRFTRCHLNSSGKDFPACPEGSEVSSCTAGMDALTFNTYTEFFTHSYAICHFLQSETWQRRAESTIHRLMETSAGVTEQLHHTKEMTHELIEAQSAALQAQRDILSSGEELRDTLRDSTQGLQSVFSDLSSTSRQQQVALTELFNRVSFMQSFLLMEAHSLSSCCYNAAALCTSFLLTSTARSSRARLVLLLLVCLNFYLERKIYQIVTSSGHPEHLHMELVSVYVGVLRRFMLCVGVCVLLLVCVRYRDPVQQSLQVLQELRETQRRLQEVLRLAEHQKDKQQTEDSQLDVKRKSESRRRVEKLRRKEEEPRVTDGSTLSHVGQEDDFLLKAISRTSHDASVQSRRRRSRYSSPASPLVYSILVEEEQQHHYSLRRRHSDAL